MTKYWSNYINKLTHSDGLKRYVRFTNNVIFELSWNITSKIKYKRLERIV